MKKTKVTQQPIVVHNTAELVKQIRKRIRSTNRFVIGIDGFMSSGKSPLSATLADKLNATHIELDNFFTPPIENYVNDLPIGDIATTLKQHNRDSIVIEGLCLLDVLDRISLQVDVLVYIKRFSEEGIWQDGDKVEEFRKQPTSCNEGLFGEFEYFLRRAPHTKANVIVELISRS
jgi:hypothetical protein